MPLVAPPVEAEEQPFRILIPDAPDKPGHRAGPVYSRDLTRKEPKTHSSPGYAQESAQDRPHLIASTAWPLGKAIAILEPLDKHEMQEEHAHVDGWTEDEDIVFTEDELKRRPDEPKIEKHPGHDDQSVHDPRSSAAQAGKRVPVSKKLRRELLEDGAAHSCTWCGYASENPREFDVDHKVPVKLGGRTVRANLHVACSMCNRSRGAQEHADPSKSAPWAERSRQRRMGPAETADVMAEAMRRIRGLSNMLKYFPASAAKKARHKI